MDSPGGDAESGRYDDENRAFLQAFIARGTMTFKESKSILAAIFTAGGTPTAAENVTEDDFLAYVAAAQEALSPFDIEIQSAQHQVSKNRVYAIVNSTSDLLSQGATIRSPEEIAYIKRVIDAMFDTYNTPKREIMGVTSMQALESKVRKGTGRQTVEDEAASTQIVDKGVTSQQAEKVLQDMLVEGWFERSKEGWYTLSPRALMELKNWLLEAYNDPADDPEEWQRIKMCVACKEIVTVGQRCPNEECTTRLHDICQSDYWKSTPGGANNKKCPKCETEWTGRNWVGEKAETTTERYQKGRRRPSGKQRQEQQVEQEEEESEEEDAEGEEE